MPGETEGWALESWRGAWGPKQSTSAAAVADWQDVGLGLLLPLRHTRALLKHIIIVLHLKISSSRSEAGKSATSSLTCCCLLVLWVLDWAGSWVARRTSMLWRTTLLGLACRRGRGLGVLCVGVQGGAGVGILLMHWPRRHCVTGVTKDGKH